MSNKSLLRGNTILTQKTPEITQTKIKCHNVESMLDSVDTGFGGENILVKDPKPNQWKTHLLKENYLNEFKTESDKTLVRSHLGVYSKSEVDTVIENKLVDYTSGFVTVEKVKEMLDELDYVESTIKAYSDYQIPNNLFRL